MESLGRDVVYEEDTENIWRLAKPGSPERLFLETIHSDLYIHSSTVRGSIVVNSDASTNTDLINYSGARMSIWYKHIHKNQALYHYLNNSSKCIAALEGFWGERDRVAEEFIATNPFTQSCISFLNLLANPTINTRTEIQTPENIAKNRLHNQLNQAYGEGYQHHLNQTTPLSNSVRHSFRRLTAQYENDTIPAKFKRFPTFGEFRKISENFVINRFRDLLGELYDLGAEVYIGNSKTKISNRSDLNDVLFENLEVSGSSIRLNEGNFLKEYSYKDRYRYILLCPNIKSCLINIVQSYKQVDHNQFKKLAELQSNIQFFDRILYCLKDLNLKKKIQTLKYMIVNLRCKRLIQKIEVG